MRSALEGIKTVLDFGREFSSIECKAAFDLDLDKWMLGKTLRAMMGMANLQGGGLVIVGISESYPTNLIPTPFDATLMATWDFEKLQTKAAPFFDPPINFSLEKINYDNNDYIVIQISEFESIPILAKKNFSCQSTKTGKSETIFREGGCYIRSQARLSSEEVPSATEMRRLLDYATDKKLGLELAKLKRHGLIVAHHEVSRISSKDQYEKQLKGIL